MLIWYLFTVVAGGHLCDVQMKLTGILHLSPHFQLWQVKGNRVLPSLCGCDVLELMRHRSVRAEHLRGVLHVSFLWLAMTWLSSRTGWEILS